MCRLLCHTCVTGDPRDAPSCRMRDPSPGGLNEHLLTLNSRAFSKKYLLQTFGAPLSFIGQRDARVVSNGKRSFWI